MKVVKHNQSHLLQKQIKKYLSKFNHNDKKKSIYSHFSHIIILKISFQINENKAP